VAEASARQALALTYTGTLARPLAPPPTRAERDVLVVGRARWWSAIPGDLFRILTRPVPGIVDASIVAFEQAWSVNDDQPYNVQLARLRTRFFWVVPLSLLALVVALVVRPPRWFEPLEIDLAPAAGVRLLGLLVPGVPQITRSKSVRGVLLLAPFVYVAQTLWNASQNHVLVPWLQEFARLDARTLAGLTAECVPGIAGARIAQGLELAGVLAGLYLLHWLDLGLARRRVARQARDAGAAAAQARRSARVIVPVDSEPGLPPLVAPPLGPADGPAERHGDRDGPFDRTEPGSPPPAG
jgi:hypothetical protein